MKILVAFKEKPASHWIPRLQAGGVKAESIGYPTVSDDGTVTGLPEKTEGVKILVNGDIADAMRGKRDDLVVLPQPALRLNNEESLEYPIELEQLTPV